MADIPKQSSKTAVLKSFSQVEEEDGESSSRRSSSIEGLLTLTRHIHLNDPYKLKRFLDSVKSKDELKMLVNARDDAGKSPLDVAACLGRVKITKLLIMNGAKIDSFTSKGYTCLHRAAAWGQLPVLKALVENGGTFTKQNIYGETPKDIAMRYNQEDCVEYLDLLAQKKILRSEISNTLEKAKDIEKLSAGRVTKDEKNMVISLCLDIQEWLETMTGTSQDIAAQLALLIQNIQPVFNKLNEP